MRPRPLLFLLYLLVACNASPSDEQAKQQYVIQIQQWHENRVASLKSPTGWLNLAGLFWLEEGENPFGSAPDNAIVFPEKAPARLGTLVVRGERVEFVGEPGVEVTYQSKPVQRMTIYTPGQDQPVVLEHGSLAWFVIPRDGRLAVRLRDYDSEAAANFAGIETFPIDPAWRLEARLKPYDPPKMLDVPTVLGTVRREPSPGALVFEYKGETYQLDVISREEDGQLFVIFADETSGKETYGAGRFLYVAPPDENGRTVLDFNKAYNPPCAFTPYATCPLPPAQNRLPFAVTAGEKAYHYETS